MKLKAIVFDLDDTLLDTTGLLIPIARTPAFYQRIREPLPLMEGARENLEYLHKKYDLFLLTYGHVESQKTKARSLGIENYFKELFFSDPAKNENKQQYFHLLSQRYSPKDILSIGNRRSTDIREAKLVQTWTCLFKYGEHLNEEIVVPEDRPDFEVSTHKEIISTCQL